VVAVAAMAPLVIGVWLAFAVLRSAVLGNMTLFGLLGQVVIGLALLLLNLQVISSVGSVDRRLARTMLGPRARDVLQRRVSELAASRAGVMAAVDTERRRIERDLHDGVQQRLVALGMLLGRARRSRDLDAVHALVRQAHEAAQHSLDDLREVAWRVYPSTLEHAGLDEVLAMVAQRSSVPVRIRCDLPVRPPRQVETVLYFVVCEAITNAAKHAGANLITVDIERRGETIVGTMHDDGNGGADPTGGGLTGLAERVHALDGTLRVDSPPGGPTTLVAELPCG
jgi:signal transduction histidine kinase